MPNSAEHQAKYTANRQFLNTGNNGTPLSTLDGCWAAIVAFYSALHLVDRLAARINLHPTPPGAHGTRLAFVTRHHRRGHPLQQGAGALPPPAGRIRRLSESRS
jgi:hypothetical protein